MLPLAHAGHYALWALYAAPVIVVVAGIVKTTLAQRRRDRAGDAGHRDSAGG